ncbi:adenylate/guanylate cyclase domain-containing protein [Bradyrhizobium sp. RDM4]|uniref:adenylate/guanylate cyclase domain-containing protein n=1 Tax=Bradyrhizobium sp. RDM4 TaxID=3378765 RepID=UPI0038FCD3F6
MEAVERRLAAILAADVVGYSSLMEKAEEATFAQIGRLRREVIEPALARHKGRLIKTTGDGVLAEFASPVSAVRCGIDIQEMLAATAGPIHIRIGINLGDVIVDEQGDVFGEGINIAARLEGLADPGGILVSGKVHSEIEGKLVARFEDRGDQQLKNISRPVRAYALCTDTGPTVALAASQGSRPLLLPDKPSIAVLPFQNMSGDPEQEYFADGIVEDIITALSRFKALFVIARNSSFTYKGRPVDIKQVGRELGVRYVLEGSVRRAANRLRITGQLIDASTGSHLWADRFEGTIQDVFELQDRVAESVVGAIAPAIDQAEFERARRKPTDSLDAHGHYLRGLAKLYQFDIRHTFPALEEALKSFQTAIDIDPDFASAYAAAATCYVSAKAYGRTIAAATDDASELKRLTRRAIELGKDDAWALALSAWALAYFSGELHAAASVIDRALAVNSNLAEAWHCGGWMKNWLGQREVALERFAHAMRLSPFDPHIAIMKTGTAHCYFFLGQYDEAVRWADLAFQDAPENQAVLRIKAASHTMAGQAQEAVEAIGRLRQLNPSLRIFNLKDVLGPYGPKDLSRYEDALRRAGLPE